MLRPYLNLGLFVLKLIALVARGIQQFFQSLAVAKKYSQKEPMSGCLPLGIYVAQGRSRSQMIFTQSPPFQEGNFNICIPLLKVTAKLSESYDKMLLSFTSKHCCFRQVFHIYTKRIIHTTSRPSFSSSFVTFHWNFDGFIVLFQSRSALAFYLLIFFLQKLPFAVFSHFRRARKGNNGWVRVSQ